MAHIPFEQLEVPEGTQLVIMKSPMCENPSDEKMIFSKEDNIRLYFGFGEDWLHIPLDMFKKAIEEYHENHGTR